MIETKENSIMYSRSIIFSCVIVLVLAVQNCSCKSKYFLPPKDCQNEPESNQENCLKNFCLANKYKFVCQAYDCKKNNIGDGIIEKMEKLKCIKTACASNPTEKVCVELKNCNAKKTTEGLFSFIGCIITLFQE